MSASRAAENEPWVQPLVLEAADAAFVATPSPWVRGQLEPSFALYGEYAHEMEIGDSRLSRLDLRVIAALTVLDRARFVLDVPTTVHAEAARPSSPVSGGVGSPRLAGRLEAVEPREATPGLALGLGVALPSSTNSARLSADEAVLTSELVTGGQPGNLDWSAALCGTFAPANDDPGQGEVALKLAWATRVGPVRLGLETTLALSLAQGLPLDDERAWRWEPLALAQLPLGPALLTLAAGPGILDGQGTPAFRAVAGLAMAIGGPFRPRPSDARAPEASQRLAGTAQASSAPPVTPGESIGTARPTVTATSPAVLLTASTIHLARPFNFKPGSAELDPSSEPLLAEVARVFAANPTIVRVAVDGHTDDRGDFDANLRLSRARALAVVSWLNDHGVDPRRTEARGFGSKHPVADNETDEGRALNRRVELVILSRSDHGEAAWAEGTLPGATP